MYHVQPEMAETYQKFSNKNARLAKELEKINSSYTLRMQARHSNHSDGLIFTRDGTYQIEGIIECKPNPNNQIGETTQRQIQKQTENLNDFVQKYNQMNSGEVIKALQPRDISVVIIKPQLIEPGGNKRYKSIEQIKPIGMSRAFIIRSGITRDDLDIAKSVFEETLARAM